MWTPDRNGLDEAGRVCFCGAPEVSVRIELGSSLSHDHATNQTTDQDDLLQDRSLVIGDYLLGDLLALLDPFIFLRVIVHVRWSCAVCIKLETDGGLECESGMRRGELTLGGTIQLSVCNGSRVRQEVALKKLILRSWSEGGP